MLDEFDLFKDFLLQQKLRWTPQRKMILDVFLSFKGHVQIESLYKKVQELDPSIGIATLYRTLNLLVECELARIFHEKEVVNPFQAYRIRLSDNSKKGIRRDRLYTHPS